ncbi:hypothetical protein SAMN06295912_1592 [Sphingomonas laterariae]|uniref:Uncharacterized protein n=2 Tax=Edaphosphingomonas laterariae TaxID=861865 RepID=A0A239KRX5_9SPHN|nr:hypothetical protein SAMN06295912_1592 [Sphingomonas laterariae]
MPVCPLRIVDDFPVEVTAGYLSFVGSDGDGALRILVSSWKWEKLQADAAHFCDSDDRRDHALGMIEATAAGLVPAFSTDGRRYIMLD